MNLWEHQVKAIRLAEKYPDLGLLFEQGTGKTRTMIEILRRRYASKGVLQKTLIFAPLIVCQNWKEEFKKFSKINPNDIVILNGTGKSRVSKLIDELGENLTKSKIIITNYEAVQMESLYKLLMLWSPDILVCDESQRLKNHESVRAKKIAAIADLTSQNFILTGTPILNTAMDVFMQFRILDRGETFGKNFYSFRGQYFEDANAGFKGKQSYFPKWEPRSFTYDELFKRVHTKGLRVLKSECLDLPPFIRQNVYTELSKEQKSAYTEMYKEYIAFIKSKEGESRTVVAQLAVTKALRLQQIVSGFAVDDTGAVHRLPCPRLDVLEELLEDIAPNHKVIVWASFKENYKMIAEVCDKLKLKYRMIHGEIKDTQKEMREFRSDPEIRVMIANQQAGGVGVNLIEASYAIYYSKNFSLEGDLQSEARNYRGGSEVHEKVTRIDIIAQGTIDELVTEKLIGKQKISDSILDLGPLQKGG